MGYEHFAIVGGVFRLASERTARDALKETLEWLKFTKERLTLSEVEVGLSTQCHDSHSFNSSFHDLNFKLRSFGA